jgi:hypothetical protein
MNTLKRLKKYFSKDEASLIVEAAVVIPLFLMFILTFLFFSDTFFTQAKMQIALNQTAQEIANYGYLYNSGPAKKSSEVIGAAVGVLNTLQEFPNYDCCNSSNNEESGKIPDVPSETDIQNAKNSTSPQVAGQPVKAVPWLETIYDKIQNSPAALIGTTILTKKNWTNGYEAKVDATIAKVLLKKHLVSDGDSANMNKRATAMLTAMGLRGANGERQGLDGIDWTGTSIYNDEKNPIVFPHDWEYVPDAFKIEYEFEPLEGKGSFTNLKWGGSVNLNKGLQLMKFSVDPNSWETKFMGQEYATAFSAAPKPWGTEWKNPFWHLGEGTIGVSSALFAGCKLLGEQSYNMVYHNYYIPKMVTSKGYESCESKGTPILETTTRTFPRNLITLQASFRVEPFSWFSKFSVPMTIKTTAESWVPPDEREAKKKSTSFTPGATADINTPRGGNRNKVWGPTSEKSWLDYCWTGGVGKQC